MSTSRRVEGHKLMGEGAAYDGYRTLMQPFSRSTAGRGRAWCECGELSDVYETAADRKRWHREHKAAILGEASP